MQLSKIFLPLLLFFVPPADATHLREADVAALEAKCEERRTELLTDDKLAAYDECIAGGEADEMGCREKAAQTGEVRRVGTNYFIGEYYDIPECLESYRARKHYEVNPSPRDR